MKDFLYSDGSPREPYIEFDVEGKHYTEPDHTTMILMLLEDDDSGVRVGPATDKDGNSITGIYLLVSDIFYPAADAEDIPYRDIPELFELHKKYPKWGTILWACKKRKCLPWSHKKYYIDKMKEEGAWEPELDTYKHSC